MSVKLIFNQILELVKLYKNELKWLSFISLITFLITPLIVFYIVLQLPQDYFVNCKSRKSLIRKKGWGFKIFLILIKNMLGLLFIVSGVILLFMPGQGVLTILIGVILLDFPGKYRLERQLITKPGVYETINRMRARFGKPPLLILEQQKLSER